MYSKGHAPAAALFASHGRYKREAYRGSEFAPRILAENGLQVVMKVCVCVCACASVPLIRIIPVCFFSGVDLVIFNSPQSDHPVLDSRFLLWEAQQAYYYGLPHHLALAAVTSTPAAVMGQGHRIGFVKEGAVPPLP